MEEVHFDLFCDQVARENIESVLLIKALHPQSPLIDGFDELYVVIVSQLKEKIRIENILHNSSNIQVRWVDQQYFVHIIENRFHRRFVQWTLQGKVLYDKNNYIGKVRDKFSTYPSVFHQRTICIEFTYFLRNYLEAKEYLGQKQFLDAYTSMFRALHHWARLAIIEAGEVPETVVWQQVSKIDYSIFKLYEELITTTDPLEKRIELLLLASEFSVISKIAECSQFLLDIMSTRHEPWSVNELIHHPELQGVQFDLILLLEKLARRSLVREVVIENKGKTVKKYSVV
jgi:hypothetical protein